MAAADNSVNYEDRAQRMINRWAGIRGKTRTDEERKVNEIFTDRCELEWDDTLGEFIIGKRTSENYDLKCMTFVLTEAPKRVPILAKCQVLVVGGGPSGLSAAISSARAGADTILCEKFGCFGGVITTVGMETIAWYRYEGCINDTEVNSKLDSAASQSLACV